MFYKDKPTTDRPISNSATLINAGTVIDGDLYSENDLRIDGTVNGNVSSTSKVVIGPSGTIKGNIDGQMADITGKVTGNVTVKEMLQLRGQSEVDGNIAAASIQVESGAKLKGHYHVGTGANVVVMAETDVEAKAK
jgi:cytoskeletal protein CcmA (bactofilin family)